MKIIIRNIAVWFIYMPVLAVIVSSCSGEGNKAQKSKDVSQNVLKINTAAAVGRSLHRTIEITGTLAPWEEIVVGNETPGTVDKIFVDLGDKVEEGKLILKLNQQDARANLESAEALLDTHIRALERAKAVWTDAELNLKRYMNLFTEGVASISQRDAVQTQYNVADAQLKQAEAQVNYAKAQVNLARKHLADTEIRSPIAGHIKKKLVSEGEVLRDKTPLFIVVKNDPLKFQGSVPESFAPHIRIDQDIVIYIDAFPNESFSGKIIRTSPSIDIQTRTLSIEALIPNPKSSLKSGFFAKAVIVMKEEKDIPFIPEASVYSFAGINKVYVIAEGMARERSVKTGMRDAGMVEITKGLKPGEIVATTGLDQLFDGA
ncbi:MAG: efflux RND transporter periplasmic adaptor subunit, partial [Deltaproteobacteria bacterium]